MSASESTRVSGSGKRVTLSGKACTRCRQKKKRCDQRLPKCRLCEQAGVECLGYDAAAVRQVPRGYIRELEDRVAYLELTLQQHGIQPGDTVSQPTELPLSSETLSLGLPLSGEPSSNRADVSPTGPDSGFCEEARSAAKSVVDLSPQITGAEAAFSQIFLSEIMRNAVNPHRPANRSPREEEPLSDIMGGLQDADAGPITLPSQETAQKLFKVYFNLTNLGMPLLHETALQEKLHLLYSLPRKIDFNNTHTTTESRIAAFFVFRVFAIALVALQQREPAGRWLADRYHKTALAALHEAGLPSDVLGVQALLLIAQHAYHHPTVWNAWKTVGAALRLAIELGLHRDPVPGTLSFFELDNMRRTFWVAYSMDRNLSTSLYLPCCLSDGAITAKFPSDVSDAYIKPDSNGNFLDEQGSGSKRITLHLYQYRQIQSEIRRTLHEEPFLPIDPSNLTSWQRQMHKKIDTWYRTTPRSSEFASWEKDVIETFEVTYNTALLSLYRPSPNIPSPSEPQLLVLTQAATKMLHLYRRFFRQRKLTIYWQAVENVSSAGLALLFAYVQSPKVRESMTLYALHSLVQLCSSVLWGMVEHFPSARGKRDAFDTASSRVLADLNEGVATIGDDLDQLGQLRQSPMIWSSQPVVAQGDTQLSGSAPETTPIGSTQAYTESMGADLDGFVGDIPFGLTDSDILAWVSEPAEGVPGILPMTWM